MNHSIIKGIKPVPGKHPILTAKAACAAATLIIVLASCNPKAATGSVTTYPNDLMSDNTNGQVTEIVTTSYLLDNTGKPGNIDEKYVVKYDSAGFITMITTTNGKDSVKSITAYTHEVSGALNGQVITDGNNKRMSSIVIGYDSTGKPTIAKSYDSAGKMDSYYTDLGLSKYGRNTYGKQYHPDSTLKLSWENDYDSTHYKGGWSKDSTGKETYSSAVKLDSLGNAQKMEETAISKDSATKQDVTKKTTTIFTYAGTDSHGNWTEQTEHITSDDKTKKPHLYKRAIAYRQ